MTRGSRIDVLDSEQVAVAAYLAHHLDVAERVGQLLA